MVTDVRVTDVRVTDFGVTDVRVTDVRVTDFGVTGVRVTDVRVTDFRVTDFRVTDFRVTDFRVTDFQTAGMNDDSTTVMASTVPSVDRDRTSFLRAKEPECGDLIEIFRGGYQHWAMYVSSGDVIHLVPPSEHANARASRVKSVLHNKATVKREPLKDVVGNDKYFINNYLDEQFEPRPSQDILQELGIYKNGELFYNLLVYNCEHFVTELRYGQPHSHQVQRIMKAAAAATGFAAGICIFMRFIFRRKKFKTPIKADVVNIEKKYFFIRQNIPPAVALNYGRVFSQFTPISISFLPNLTILLKLPDPTILTTPIIESGFRKTPPLPSVGLRDLYLSAAFDTVDHKVLLYPLEQDVGIRRSALNWSTSYSYSTNTSFSVTPSNDHSMPHLKNYYKASVNTLGVFLDKTLRQNRNFYQVGKSSFYQLQPLAKYTPFLLDKKFNSWISCSSPSNLQMVQIVPSTVLVRAPKFEYINRVLRPLPVPVRCKIGFNVLSSVTSLAPPVGSLMSANYKHFFYSKLCKFKSRILNYPLKKKWF